MKKASFVIAAVLASCFVSSPAQAQGHYVPMDVLVGKADRIIVGEVRGDEALDMLQAMNTGHDGSLTTIHANSPRDAVGRLETMVAMANLNIPERATRRQIASALDLIVQVSRLSDGTRKSPASRKLWVWKVKP